MNNVFLKKDTTEHSPQSAVVLSGVTKQFKNAVLPAVRNISFEIKKGEFICIIGPSGCGKSTILKMISELELPSEGSVSVSGTVAMAFQSSALLPWLSVYDNVAFGVRAKNSNPQHIKTEVEKYLSLTKLSEYADRMPRELSGGQKQRVGIARALAVSPSILLLDEPFSALDPKTTAELHDDILHIWHSTGITIVMVSHLIEEAVTLSDRIMLMKDGVITKTFLVDFPYPRREQAVDFMHKVQEIRTEFFK
jgi:NitT/TauT family transport system ATP-binding protein